MASLDNHKEVVEYLIEKEHSWHRSECE
ncbi:hypothetical protein [Wolbachia endosymbiont of Chironomus riparius]